MAMKLSEYARQQGISYKTAWRWFKSGELDAYQTATGTVIVQEAAKTSPAAGIALYARVSSADQKEDLQRQVERLKNYAAARGYQVNAIVQEIGSGLNDHRPKFLKVLTDASIGVIVVEHKDRGTRFGWNYIEQLLLMQGRRLEVIFPTEIDHELLDDFVSVITSMAARIYGKRNSTRKAEQIKRCVEEHIHDEGLDDEDSGTRL
jgi:putative resolvase